MLTHCVRAWMQAAGAIHTDFERGFICAEVMHYDELKELASEAAVKAAGKYRQEGESPAQKLPLLGRSACGSEACLCTSRHARASRAQTRLCCASAACLTCRGGASVLGRCFACRCLSGPSCAAGKNYLVQDGDVIFFKFNVTASGKK